MVHTINDTHIVRLAGYHTMLEDSWIVYNSTLESHKRNHIMEILAEISREGNYHTKHQDILNYLEVLHKKYIKYGR